MKNPYQVGLEILIENLKYENLLDGLPQTLDQIQTYLSSSDIILYRLDENNEYQPLSHTSNITYNPKDLNKVFDKYKNQNLDIEIDNNNIKRITIEKIPTDSKKQYTLFILNNNLDKEKSEKFNEIIIPTLSTILNKMEYLQEIKKLSERDYLTKLENRLCYERKIKELVKEENEHLVYILIDLFRLKYINDNINHSAGDKYIKETAEILKKYFPRYEIKKDIGHLETKKETGNYIYRIGGDEFIILSKKIDKETAIEKLELAKKEVSKINIREQSDILLTFNYGITERTKEKSISELYKESDKYLSEDKRRLYKSLNLDRRR